MADYEAQIVVVAAGPAGLAASIQAVEAGAKVIVLEKSGKAGGAANMGMDPLGIGTRYQKQQMESITVEKAFNMFMEYTHYNVDARLIRRYFGQSAETIQWLEDRGVEFEGAYRYFPQSEPTWHIVKTKRGIGPADAMEMNKILYEHARKVGVQFLFNTPGKKVLMKNGQVAGVLAEDSSGKEIEIACQAVIICTGGAGSNKEMIKEETGYKFGEDMFSFAVPGLTGDGLRMAWEAGAAKVPVRIEQAASIEGLSGLPDSVSNVMRQPNLLVNLFGKRVMNEGYMQNCTYLSNVCSHQKNRVCISIVDTSIAEYYVENGVDNVSMVTPDPDVSSFPDGIRKSKEHGNRGMFIADTIEELAQMSGIDEKALARTVEQYNEFCRSADTEFFKDRRYLRPLVKAPFYGARFRPGGYGTVGGIRINENCEACDEQFNPVPGLYAAGADACNIYDDSYMFLLPGNSMGFALNTGRIAAMTAVQKLK